MDTIQKNPNSKHMCHTTQGSNQSPCLWENQSPEEILIHTSFVFFIPFIIRGNKFCSAPLFYSSCSMWSINSYNRNTIFFELFTHQTPCQFGSLWAVQQCLWENIQQQGCTQHWSNDINYTYVENKRQRDEEIHTDELPNKVWVLDTIFSNPSASI